MRIPFLMTCATFIAATVLAQTPRPIQDREVTQISATVVAIDRAKREVVLQTADGRTTTATVPAQVERFSAMKVGDVVTARYTEAYAVAIAAPGSAAPAEESEPTLTRHTGDRPSGEITNKVNARVKVQAIDTKTPAITVEKSNGEKVDVKVDDRERLAKLKVGDEIDITYTESLMLTVNPPEE